MEQMQVGMQVCFSTCGEMADCASSAWQCNVGKHARRRKTWFDGEDADCKDQASLEARQL